MTLDNTRQSLPPLRIGILAGEASGDLLGAGLMAALKRTVRDRAIQFEGIGGPQMIAEGCHSLAPMEILSTMGLVEVLRHLPQLLRLRQRLYRHFIENPPAIFIGIDAPDFNLTLERRLHRRGILTMHYVSPSVWAWRSRRVRKIARSVDRILTLFPFEADFYRDHAVPVRFVGHPLADHIPLEVDMLTARREMGLPEDGELIAMLPGSRVGEVTRLAEPFIECMQWCREREPGLNFVVPFANAATRAVFETALASHGITAGITLMDGRAQTVMAASDAVLLASGTAALEAMLLKKPMVVAYKLAALTYLLVKPLMNVKQYSLPNLLAGEALVPELIQDQVTGEKLGQALLNQLQNRTRHDRLIQRFTELHQSLRHNADEQAAQSVLEMIGHG